MIIHAVSRRDGPRNLGPGWIFVIVGCVVAVSVAVALSLRWLLARLRKPTCHQSPPAPLLPSTSAFIEGRPTPHPTDPSEPYKVCPGVLGDLQDMRGRVEHGMLRENGSEMVCEKVWHKPSERRMLSESGNDEKRGQAARELRNSQSVTCETPSASDHWGRIS